MNELTFKLYSPLTAELVCHDPEDWCSDEVLALDGRAIVENEAEILAQIEQEGDHLEQYLDTESDSYLAAHVKSIVVSVEKRNGSLCGCATVVVDEDLTKRGWKELKDYLSGQYSDGWGEGFEQRDIQIAEGILNVHFWQPENFAITVVLAETRSQAERSAANVAATGNGNRTLQPPQPDKKYEITDIAHPVYPELHRIRALRQVGNDVPAGELGGFVQSEATCRRATTTPGSMMIPSVGTKPMSAAAHSCMAGLWRRTWHWSVAAAPCMATPLPVTVRSLRADASATMRSSAVMPASAKTPPHILHRW